MLYLGGTLQPARGWCGGDHILATAGGISTLSPHCREVGLPFLFSLIANYDFCCLRLELLSPTSVVFVFPFLLLITQNADTLVNKQRNRYGQYYRIRVFIYFIFFIV